jgi:hypothetical protein
MIGVGHSFSITYKTNYMFEITAKAPSSYQLNSLKAFNIGSVPLGNGAFQGHREFQSEQEATDFLCKQAEIYNDSDPCGSDRKLLEMYGSIELFGMLTLDAVTAYINPVEIEECNEVHLITGE